jgi:hypothetical protein
VRVLHHLVAGALIAVLVVHFTLTLGYLTPPNAIGIRLRPVIDRYMEPYFSQAWSLFAPDPVVDTRELLVSCRVRDPDGSQRDTAWANITSPLRAQRAVYRIGPSNTVERAQLGPLHVVLAPAAPTTPPDAAPTGTGATTVAEDPATARRTEDGRRLLRRVASAVCDRSQGAGVTVAVAVRMLRTESPPFSRRHEPLSTSKTTYLDFPWGPHERVAPL